MARGIHFEDNSRRILTEIERVGAGAMTKAALVVEGQAKLLASVDTGDLRDSITHDVSAEGSRAEARVGSTLDYSIYQEFGTGEFAENGAGRKGGWRYKTPDGKWHFTMGVKPVKFLRNAFRKTKPQVKQILADDLGVNFKGR